MEFIRRREKRLRVALVTFASGSYKGIEKKLITSVKEFNPYIDTFAFHDESEIGSPLHKDAPYAFKPYAVDFVRRKGYDVVIWCDSCLRAVSTLDGLVNDISARGVYLQRDGLNCGQWANDAALQYFNVTRDQSMKIESIYAQCMGFDFRTKMSYDFLSMWLGAAQAGIFKGRWNNDEKTESEDSRVKGHRHDQTSAELISHHLRIIKGPIIAHDDPTRSPRYFTTWDHP